MVSLEEFAIDPTELERRKQLFRDLWAGKPVDHIPVQLIVSEPDCPYTVREQFQDTDKQLEVALRSAGLSYAMVPGGDCIPAMRPDVGCSGLATAFGCELYWGDDPDQTCGVRDPILDDVEQAYDLEVPSPDGGVLAEGIDRIRVFSEAGEGLVAVSLLDMAGGLNVCVDLLGGDKVYMAMYDNPEALECLLGKVQQLFLATIARQIEAAGGQERITTTDFPDYWFPEGRKGHVSDDISANISPDLYDRFSLPFHNMVFEQYGGGGLHNCGPNPCLEGYLKHTPPPRAIDLSYMYSSVDLPRIKELCRRKALVYLDEIPGTPPEVLATYRGIMEQMAPDVIVVPVVRITTDDDPADVYAMFREVTDEYAKRMEFGFDQ